MLICKPGDLLCCDGRGERKSLVRRPPGRRAGGPDERRPDDAPVGVLLEDAGPEDLS